MKAFLLLFLLCFISCASNTEYYPVLQKSEFLKKTNNTIHHGMTSRKGKKYHNNTCSGQILFFNNAHNETEQALKNLIEYACPNTEYLLETKIKKIWWTTLIYSRSCMEITAYCPYK